MTCSDRAVHLYHFPTVREAGTTLYPYQKMGISLSVRGVVGVVLSLIFLFLLIVEVGTHCYGGVCGRRGGERVRLRGEIGATPSFCQTDSPTCRPTDLSPPPSR